MVADASKGGRRSWNNDKAIVGERRAESREEAARTTIDVKESCDESVTGRWMNRPDLVERRAGSDLFSLPAPKGAIGLAEFDAAVVGAIRNLAVVFGTAVLLPGGLRPAPADLRPCR